MRPEREVGSIARDRRGSGPSSWAESSWHSDGIQVYPTSTKNFDSLQLLIHEYVLTGQIPKKPLIKSDTTLVTLGSCFAAELRYFLNDVGLSSDSFWVPSGLNNTFAIRDFFHWVINGENPAEGYAYEKDAQGQIRDWVPKNERLEYLDKIKSASAFVFTLGLAEVWKDKQTRKTFWRGVPQSIFDEKRHDLVMTGVEQNSDNLQQIIEYLKSVNSSAPIILTLSPVPLKATFEGKSCVTSDCVSKSTLRVSINEVMNLGLDNVWYWPSFEIVKWVGCHLPYPVYGTDDGVIRHVSRYIVLQILQAFINVYYGAEIAEKIFDDYTASLDFSIGSAGEPPVIYQGKIVGS